MKCHDGKVCTRCGQRLPASHVIFHTIPGIVPSHTRGGDGVVYVIGEGEREGRELSAVSV